MRDEREYCLLVVPSLWRLWSWIWRFSGTFSLKCWSSSWSVDFRVCAVGACDGEEAAELGGGSLRAGSFVDYGGQGARQLRGWIFIMWSTRKTSFRTSNMNTLKKNKKKTEIRTWKEERDKQECIKDKKKIERENINELCVYSFIHDYMHVIIMQFLYFVMLKKKVYGQRCLFSLVGIGLGSWATYFPSAQITRSFYILCANRS